MDNIAGPPVEGDNLREMLIEKSAVRGRTQYRIAEQLFRLWLQLRGGRRSRRKVVALAEFIEAVLEPPTAEADESWSVSETRPDPAVGRSAKGKCGKKENKGEEALVKYAAPSEAAAVRQRRALVSARDALESGHPGRVSALLSGVLSESEDQVAALAHGTIVDLLIAPIIPNKRQAGDLLAILWELGFDIFARPLLYAFEAAIESRPESIDDLEPEVRAATRLLYERLVSLCAGQYR